MKYLKSFNLPVKLAISASILIALTMRMDTDIFGQMANHFKASAWFYATLLIMAQCVLLSLRWQYLLNTGKTHLTFLQSLQVNLTSQLANLIFITSIGGMVARIALSVQSGATLFKSIIATAFDRVMTLSALLLLSAMFMPGLGEYVDSKTFTTLATYISTFIITMFLFAPLFINFVLLRLPQMAKLKGRMRYGFRYLKVTINKPLLCGKIVLTSLAAQACFFLSVIVLAQASGADLTMLQMMTVLPMVVLVSSLPISIGGWGIREGAFVYGFGLLGVPMEISFLISIQVGLIGMLTTVLLGMPSLMTSNIRLAPLSFMKENLARLRF